MKKLTTIALMGALTFGAVSAIELTSPTTKVAAAVQDNWPYKYFPELHNVDDNERLNFGNLKHGQTITVNEPIGGGDSATVKIYRVMDDFSLARYKTIEDSDPAEYNGKFTTTITPVYEPGNYVAVMQYTFESEGKFHHYYTTGNMFSISK
ncbi:DUF5065 family protein [Bacillus wiedmannii]|uniref:DUF5065 family protein n=1 Tax=Bacillus wiedmannii TaxID=1890302 RepID=UPI000BFB1D4D|nr:DUF5065 family protein [Bacillus wiedmannii]PHE70542.1 DUF5065 domain-containing protein [Bacillus wiedmannii]